MKKFIYPVMPVMFACALSTCAMAAQQNDGQNVHQAGDPITLMDGRRVRFVSANRPTDIRGMEHVLGLGWVRIVSSQQTNQNNSSSSIDGLTDTVLSHGIAFGTACVIGLLKKEAVDTWQDGYVELAPIVSDLLSNGVWENIHKLPGKLISLGLSNSWSTDEKELAKVFTNIVTKKFTDGYQDETIDNLDDFVKSLGLSGLYINPKRISDILHGSAKKWDEASGLQLRTTTQANNGQRTSSNTVTGAITDTERAQVLSVLSSNSQINRNVREGYDRQRRDGTFTGDFTKYVDGIIEGAIEIGMRNDLDGYIKMIYQ